MTTNKTSISRRRARTNMALLCLTKNRAHRVVACLLVRELPQIFTLWWKATYVYREFKTHHTTLWRNVRQVHWNFTILNFMSSTYSLLSICMGRYLQRIRCTWEEGRTYRILKNKLIVSFADFLRFLYGLFHILLLFKLWIWSYLLHENKINYLNWKVFYSLQDYFKFLKN